MTHIHSVFDIDISMLCLRDHIFVSHSTSSTFLFKPCSAESVIYSLFPVSIYHSLYPLCQVHCKREMNKLIFMLRFRSLLFISYTIIFSQLVVLPNLESGDYLKPFLKLSRKNKYADFKLITHNFMCNRLFMPQPKDTVDNA